MNWISDKDVELDREQHADRNLGNNSHFRNGPRNQNLIKRGVSP